jgi:hypothetical protein
MGARNSIDTASNIAILHVNTLKYVVSCKAILYPVLALILVLQIAASRAQKLSKKAADLADTRSSTSTRRKVAKKLLKKAPKATTAKRVQ